jgi:hypothetical protein
LDTANVPYPVSELIKILGGPPSTINHMSSVKDVEIRSIA